MMTSTTTTKSSIAQALRCADNAVSRCEHVSACLCAAKDGTIAEYDVDKPSQTRGLRLTSLHHLAGPTAMSPGPSPTALAFAPPLPYFTQGCSDTLLLVADEAYKLRVYNADSHLCISTAVGPLHGGPINSCRVFRSEQPSAFFAVLLGRLSSITHFKSLGMPLFRTVTR